MLTPDEAIHYCRSCGQRDDPRRGFIEYEPTDHMCLICGAVIPQTSPPDTYCPRIAS